MKRPRALMLPAGLHWPRVLLDAETTACMQVMRATGAAALRPGWTGIATGAPAAGLMRKVMGALPEASALYFAGTDPVPRADAIAHASAEVQGLPVRGLEDLPESNGTRRLVLAPGFAGCRADLVALDQWRRAWADLTRAGDLLAFTLPAWTDPALLEARWSMVNPGATVVADPRKACLTVATPAGVSAGISHLQEARLPEWLAAGGFTLEVCCRVDQVFGVLARRLA